MASSYMTMERTPNEYCNLTETSINKLVEFKIHKALLSFFLSDIEISGKIESDTNDAFVRGS